jgi:hypothetical protein
MGGDEVLMVYHRYAEATSPGFPVPLKALVDFERVQVDAGSTGKLYFTLDNADLGLVNEVGDTVLLKGSYFVAPTPPSPLPLQLTYTG